MRKVSELLPIVRQHLRSDTNPRGNSYICYASSEAYLQDRLDAHEYVHLQKLIYARMDAQNPEGCPNVLLVYRLLELGVIQRLTPASRVDDPAYRVHRDKWLDDWQAELEGAGQ